MNERIRALAEQASFTREIPYPHQDAVFQKFAELIIQECVSAALEEVVGDDELSAERDLLFKAYLKGNNGGVVDAVSAIKQHFGVGV